MLRKGERSDLTDASELLIASLSTGLPPIELGIHKIASAKTGERLAYYVFPKVNTALRGTLFPEDYSAAVSRNAVGSLYTEWTLSHLLTPMKTAIDRGSDFTFIALDLSLRALSDDRSMWALSEYDGQLSKEARAGICLTFSSEILFSDLEKTVEALQALRGRGYMVGLRDFGSDYCPTLRLPELPIDAVFLSEEFTEKLIDDPDQYSPLIKFINSLDCLTVLCGDFEPSELSFAAAQSGCDGYLTNETENTIN